MEKGKKIFLVWEVDNEDEDQGFWNQYETLEDAVSDGGDGTEVFTATPKLLGRFNRKTVMVKVKRRKRRKARKPRKAKK